MPDLHADGIHGALLRLAAQDDGLLRVVGREAGERGDPLQKAPRDAVWGQPALLAQRAWGAHGKGADQRLLLTGPGAGLYGEAWLEGSDPPTHQDEGPPTTHGLRGFL